MAGKHPETGSTLSLLEMLNSGSVIDLGSTDSLLADLASLSIQQTPTNSSNRSKLDNRHHKLTAWEQWLLEKEKQARTNITRAKTRRKIQHQKMLRAQQDKEKRLTDAQLHWKKWAILKNQQLRAAERNRRESLENKQNTEERKKEETRTRAEEKYKEWFRNKQDEERRKQEEEKAKMLAEESEKLVRQREADTAYRRWKQTAGFRRSQEKRMQPLAVESHDAVCWRQLVSTHHMDHNCCCQCSHLPDQLTAPVCPDLRRYTS